jgi:hypothetical protein
MAKIPEKLRIMLRNMYIALGATAIPVSVYAGYGQPQPDPRGYTVPVQGRVVSEETGEPIAGIIVRYDYHATVDTDGDGSFFIYVPEEDSCAVRFFDNDGFENGGFFSTKYMNITREEIGDPLMVSLYRENQVTVIRGTVRSTGTGEPVSGISVSIRGDSSGERYTPFSGFVGFSDDNGQFSIQVPERDTYSIMFHGGGLFRWKEIVVRSDEIKDSLKVDLEEYKYGEDVE